MHECVCVCHSFSCLPPPSSVCLWKSVLCKCTRVCLCGCGWMSSVAILFRYFQLKISLFVKLKHFVSLSVCVYWFVCVVLIPTQQHSVSGYFLRRCCCYFASVGVHDRFQKSWQFGSLLFSPLAFTTLKKGKQRARRAISPKKVRRGRTNRGGPEFFFCFVL